jgi:flagellar hook-associated protein 3 FlgL
VTPKIDSAGEQFLLALRGFEERSERAHQQVSSGFRVSSVSDEPAGVPALLQLQTEMAATDQLMRNLTRVRAEVETADGALQDVVRLLDDARVLGLQGATEIDTSTRRPILARQVQSILDQVISFSQVQSEGQLVFGGSAEASRLVQLPNGGTFPFAKTAGEVFDERDGGGNPTSGNVFDALESLRLGLENDDTAAIEQALNRLSTASDHLNRQLAWYGNVQDRIATVSAVAAKFQTHATIRLSEMRDADLPAAIVELTQTQTQQQAALSAQAQLPRLSLFDFLR